MKVATVAGLYRKLGKSGDQLGRGLENREDEEELRCQLRSFPAGDFREAERCPEARRTCISSPLHHSQLFKHNF